MASKVIAFRVPEDIADELQKVSEERGITIAYFMRSLVDEALYPLATLRRESDDTMREKVQSLSDAHGKLANDVQELSNKIHGIVLRVSGYELAGVDLKNTFKLLSSQLGIIDELPTRVKQFESEIATLKTKCALMAREIRRRPADEIRKVYLNDGTERRFMVYKSDAGLVKPSVLTRDPVSGNKYIDLSEPLD